MQKKPLYLGVAGILIVIGAAVVALQAAGGLASLPSRETSGVTRVEARYVCMVNNKLFDKKQIPVQVGNRTYYGCCEMCEKTLRENAEHRTAIDPVSGRLVDKATCVIGAQSDGTVVYFENEANLRRFGRKSHF